MKETGIAIVVCVITGAVVMYAVFFMSSRSQRIRRERQTVTMQLDAEVKEREEERWRTQTVEADEYYNRMFALRQELRQSRREYISPKEQWMQECLQVGVFSKLDRMNHKVATDSTSWAIMTTDLKWQMMELVHRYFDGYATIVSSASGHPLASYNAWGGIKIHD